MTSIEKSRHRRFIVVLLLVLIVSGCSITTRTKTKTSRDNDGNIIERKQSWEITTPLGTLGKLDGEDEDEPDDDQ
ncbi:MAG: hypothetical protein OSB09_10970 [Planctomycetota bacterium]|nr:hypothetical protein [Planctomycetota bacterium]